MSARPTGAPRSRGAPVWDAFYRTTRLEPAHITTSIALRSFDREGGSGRRALDLGCGAGRDTWAMLERGWRVTAIDANRDALAHVRPSLLANHAERLTFTSTRFEEFQPDHPVALVNASLAMPFCKPRHFSAFCHRVLESIEPEGRFAGHFLGPHDDWTGNRDMTFVTRSAVQALFSDFEIELLKESDLDDHDAGGRAKHWHVFGVVARKTSREAQR